MKPEKHEVGSPAQEAASSLQHATDARVLLRGPAELEVQHLQFAPELLIQLGAFLGTSNVTLTSVLQGAWAVVLNRYSREPIVRYLRRIEHVAGHGVTPEGFELVALEVPENAALLSWLEGLHAGTLVRFLALDPNSQDADTLELPQAGFLYRAQAVGIAEVHGTPLELHNRLAWPRCALTLQACGDLRNLRATVHYDAAVYSTATMSRLSGHLSRVIEEIATNGSQRIGDVCILQNHERQQLLVEWNATCTDLPDTATIHELFRAQVERTPNFTAVVCQGHEVTYAELDVRATKLSHVLRVHGVGPDVLVAVCIPRSVEMIVAVLGILKAGGAYVGLDSSYPNERLEFVLREADITVMLTVSELRDNLPRCKHEICLDGDWEATADQSGAHPGPTASAHSLAYVSYTSGSTGQPKGVCIPHRGVVRLVKNTNFCDMSATQVFLQLAPLSFDASTFEIWACLLNGATLVIMPPRPPTLEEIGEAIQQNKVTTLWLTAGLFHLMIDEQIERLGTVRQLLAGGDVLSPAHVQRLLQHHPDCKVINGYGPTENTTFSCTYTATNADRLSHSVPIGRPIANTTAYILDPHFRPVPVGVPGELCVAGKGLARGYLKRPDLTREKFVKNPFNGEDGERLYLTGDLARYLPDGNIEFLGRLDRQVKVRGFRVELGEIEAVLMRHASVREVWVEVLGTGASHKNLVAYLVAKDGAPIDLEELAAYSKKALPSYMVPTAYVQLPRFPLNANGKIDRRSLPNPDGDRSRRVHAAPRNDVEQLLTDLWSRALQRQIIGIHDNFFELGGDSLSATQLTHHIGTTFGFRCPLDLIFSAPTIAQMAGRIATPRGSAQSRDPVLRLEGNTNARFEAFPLTDIQQAYFVGRTKGFELGNVSCHLYLEFSSDIADLRALNVAWQKVVQRHDMLRAVVNPDGLQRVLETVPPYEFEQLDYRALSKEEWPKALQSLRDELSHEVFDPGSWPLFRICAVLGPSSELRLHLSFDLLILDGFSFLLIFEEWERFFRDLTWSPPPLAFTFRDYAIAELSRRNSRSYAQARQYWQARLDTLPSGPELPTITTAAQITSPTFKRVQSRLPAAKWTLLKKRAQERGLTPSIVLCTAYAEVLAAWSQSPRFTLNLTLFNRVPVHPDVERIVGDFTTLTLLELDTERAEAFEARAQQLHRRLFEDLEHREYSGVRVLRDYAERHGSGNTARMPVVFTSLLRDFSKWDWLGTLDYSITQTPQVWLDHVAMESASDLMFHWDYVEQLFPVDLVEDMFRAYCELLEALTVDDEAWSTETRVVPPKYQLSLQTEVNRTGAPVDPELLHSAFERRARARPEHPALVTSSTTFTYGELDAMSNRLSRELRGCGAVPGQPVSVVMEKGWEQVVAVLAILKAGCAYVPVSATLPADRIAGVLSSVGDLVITQGHVNHRLHWPPGNRLVCVERNAFREHESTCLTLDSRPLDLAYVIFTSGSTGKPKGVMIDHRGAVNTCRDINARFQVTEQDRVFGLSSLDFDLSVYDIFGTLACGATLVLPDAGSERDPAHWLELITREGVTIWNSVPALMQMLCDYVASHENRLPSTLRRVLLSGDWIPLKLPDAIRALQPSASVVSLGGATEASIWSIVYEIADIDPRWTSIPYGKPLLNQTYHVLDQKLSPRPTWVAGDLYIGGVGVGMGYWKDEERTQAAFIVHPVTGERLYRTGDRGRYLADGNIEFLGRSDFQVKIGGHRIELGEIEAILLQHPRVTRAVATVWQSPAGEKSLAAYVVLDTPQSDSVSRTSVYDRAPEVEIKDLSARLTFKLDERGIRRELSGTRIDLAADESDTLDRFVRRRSFRRFLGTEIDLRALSRLLGNLRQVRVPNSAFAKYQYASAGGLYPVQTYCYVHPKKVANVPTGIYYFHPTENSLYMLSEGPLPSTLHDPENQQLFEEAAFTIFLVADLSAIRPMYGVLSEPFCWMEAGIITHLLETRAPEDDLGLCQIGGFRFEAVSQRLNMGSRYRFMHCLLGGAIDPEWFAGGIPERPKVSTTSRDQDALMDELRDHVSRKLPSYMVPRWVTEVREFPVTANGKINRDALPPPAPGSASQAAVVRPASEREEKLLEIFKSVLKVETVSTDANFFDLGGNSVQMVQIYDQMRRQFTQEIAIVDLFREPTVRGLAKYLGRTDPTRESTGRERGRRRKQVRDDFPQGTKHG